MQIMSAYFEKLTVLSEKTMGNKKLTLLVAIISLVSPIFFIKTVYAVWFGSAEVLVGFKAEQATWIVMLFVNIVTLFSVLAGRKNNRIIQIVMLLWTINVFLLLLATIVR